MTDITQPFDEILIDPEALRARIAELGAQISADYADTGVLMVGVLKGAVMFMSDLARHVTAPVELDFMATSSYGAATESSGVVKLVKDLDTPLAGRHVLVVEDIVDSGRTLHYLLDMLRQREPASVEVCALLTKPERAEVEVDCRYLGFEIPNRFVVGYGLDYAERFRNLDFIACLDESLLPQIDAHIAATS